MLDAFLEWGLLSLGFLWVLLWSCWLSGLDKAEWADACDWSEWEEARADTRRAERQLAVERDLADERLDDRPR